jgi:hypothetical protein
MQCFSLQIAMLAILDRHDQQSSFAAAAADEDHRSVSCRDDEGDHPQALAPVALRGE